MSIFLRDDLQSAVCAGPLYAHAVYIQASPVLTNIMTLYHIHNVIINVYYITIMFLVSPWSLTAMASFRPTLHSESLKITHTEFNNEEPFYETLEAIYCLLLFTTTSAFANSFRRPCSI